ncbi:hypothetical protein D9615_001979 [Tricholomella constricta]|uniref:non-specific serine/threonine protein kinase n=1 Tax=Tricholomella constricta TaxID=117010 RepID=A0A8H5HNN7_9AGAR|nr:hypothetical protein D9615_001979 [Tricholomella constricta]
MQLGLHPSPPSSISSSRSGSSRSRLSFLSSSSSSTFSDISVSSLPSPPHSGAKTNAFFASPFPTRPPSPTPAPQPPSTKTRSFFAIPAIDISTPTVSTPTVDFDTGNEPTPRPKDLEPKLSTFWPQHTPDEPTASSIISSQQQGSDAVAQNTTLRLLKPLGHGAFSSVWLADDLSPVPLVLRSRRSLRDLRRQASLKSPNSAKSPPPNNRLSLSRAGSLRKLRARVPGTRPIRSLDDAPPTANGASSSIDPSDLLQSSLSRASSTSSTSTTASSRSTKPRPLTISIVDPTSPLPSGGLSRSSSAKGRLVAVKMTVRGGAGAHAEDEEREVEKERTRVAFVREVEVLRGFLLPSLHISLPLTPGLTRGSLQHISHPNITPLLSHLSTPTHHVLVLPYLPGGDLLALVNTDAAWARLRETVLQRIWAELCRAVGWMHGVGLVHRDIKLENILLTTQIFTNFTQHQNPDQEQDLEASAPTLANLPPSPAPLIKLTDFGLSRFVDIRSEDERARDRAARRAQRRAGSESSGCANADNSEGEKKVEEEEDDDEEDEGPLLSTRCGSEAYAAPELVMGAPVASRTRARSRSRTTTTTTTTAARKPKRRGVYDARETDAWACGVVLYALVARRLPFGEGVGAGTGPGTAIGREGEARGIGMGMARRAWLMRIARGEYEWPEAGAGAEAGVDGGSHSTRAQGEGEGEGEKELMGARLAASEGARRMVGRLLVRDPRKRARIADLWGDVWMGGDGVVTGPVQEEEEAWERVEALEEGMEVVDAEEEEDLELALAEAEEEVDEFGWLVDQDGIDDIARREVV